MSLHQTVACRRRPSLPEDLPRSGEWSEDRGSAGGAYFVRRGAWVLRVSIVDPLDMDKLERQLVEAFGLDAPTDITCTVQIDIEPDTSDTDVRDLQVDVLTALDERCGGIVLPG